MPKSGKILQCKQVKCNAEDLYTISVMKTDTAVGHVLHEKSHVV